MKKCTLSRSEARVEALEAAQPTSLFCLGLSPVPTGRKAGCQQLVPTAKDLGTRYPDHQLVPFAEAEG